MRYASISRARHQKAGFGGKIDRRFQNRVITAKCGKARVKIIAGVDPDLPFAIITKLACFQNAAPLQCIHGVMQAGGVGDMPKIWGKNAMLARKILFAHPVLGNM